MAPNNELQMVLDFLSRNDEVFVFGAMAICGIVGIVFGTITSVFKTMQRERSRREIAAYIAEGSMSPEQGERLMKANQQKA